MSHPLIIEPIVRAALLEDLGRAGDITTDAVVPAGLKATGKLAARKEGRVAGLAVAMTAFRMVDPQAEMAINYDDGHDVSAGGVIAKVTTTARALLVAERTALNLMGRMSGVATATRALVRAVDGTKARIVCTRKTTPGLRSLEKWAVKLGGGANHRFGLDDAVLIKDNHIAIAGGVRPVLERAKAAVGHMVKIEIEVDTLAQLEEVLSVGGADVALLDNMSPSMLADAVKLCAGRLLTEASGNVTLETVRAIAESGVDMISVGWITHSAANFDIGLDM